MIYKIWVSLEEQDESKDHYQNLDMPEQLGIFDTQTQAESFLKLIVDFCNSFGHSVVATGTPAEDRHGCEPDKVKPLAQYLDEYIEHEVELFHIQSGMRLYEHDSWRELLEQALDAYESTENVKINIEKC